MAKPPRGIQVITYTNADNSTTTKFRVRITRKSFKGKRNNYFDDVREAIAFLKLSKLEKGKELIYSITEEQRNRNVVANPLNNKDFTFSYFAQRYLQENVFDNNPDILLTELQRRNQAMQKAFYNNICSISILDRYVSNEEREKMGVLDDQPLFRFFGKFDIRTEIKPIDINNYIKARLKGDKLHKPIKPISVVREITYISKIFNKLNYFDENLEVKNPTKDYDKSLVKNALNHRTRILTPEEELKFIEVINTYSNKQLADICKISLLTSMRRSEIINLKTTDISKDFSKVNLTITKSGRSRIVYLDNIAIEFLRNLKPAPKAINKRFFTYSIMGFGKVLSEYLKKWSLKDGYEFLENIHFHDLRRTKISKVISLGGQENTILLAKVLGFSSARKFESVHIAPHQDDLTTQKGQLETFGHSKSSIDVNFKHYVQPVMTEVEKLRTIQGLKDKMKIESLSQDENNLLFSLLLQYS